MYHIFFIHLSIDGHDSYLGCPHIMSIVNNVAMNTGIYICLFELVFWVYLDKYPEVELLDPSLSLLFFYLKNFFGVSFYNSLFLL